MKCNYCGEEINPRDRYCPNCGHINENYLTNDYNNDVDNANEDPFESVYEKRSSERFVYTPPTEEEINNVKPASVSPVFGILCLIFGILGSLVPTIIFGIIGLNKYPRNNADTKKYRNMCIAGIVIGIIMSIVSFVLIVLYLKNVLFADTSIWEQYAY